MAMSTSAWSPVNPDSDIPAITRTDTNSESRMSTYYVENGSFAKLRTIQLGYNMPKSITDKLKMERIRFYLSAQNLITIKSSKFTGADPEAFIGAGYSKSGFGYPIPLNLTFGVNVGF